MDIHNAMDIMDIVVWIIIVEDWKSHVAIYQFLINFIQAHSGAQNVMIKFQKLVSVSSLSSKLINC